MKWALLLNLVLITLVSGDGAWKQNKEYTYKVLIKTLTTSPKLNDRWIGTIFRARLFINPQSDNLLIGKIDDAEYAEIELSEKLDVHLNDADLSYNKQPLNRSFKIYLENGAIHSLFIDGSMTKDQKIQLKAIISQLQVDTNKFGSVGNNTFYKTTEETVTGNCETTYQISPLPDYLIKSNAYLIPLPELKGEVINIVKTRDHNKCTEHYAFIYGRNQYPKYNNVDHSEASRVIISGSLKDYTIQSSDTTNKVTFNDPQSFTTVHYVNLKLESMEEKTTRSSRPQVKVVYNSKLEKLSFYTKDEQTDRSNEEALSSNKKLTEGMPKDDSDWSSCYTWFVGSEEMCRQSFNGEYSSDKTENCGFAGLGHRAFCTRKYPGCEASVCWSAAIQDICSKEFGDRLPVHNGGFADCAPGFVRHRCCPK